MPAQSRPVTGLSGVDADDKDPHWTHQPRDGHPEEWTVFPTPDQSAEVVQLQLDPAVHDHHEQRGTALRLAGVDRVLGNDSAPRRDPHPHARGICGQLLELFHQGAGRDLEPLGHAGLQMGRRPHCLFQHHVFLGDMPVNRVRVVDRVEGGGVGEGEGCHDVAHICPASVAKVGLSERRAVRICA